MLLAVKGQGHWVLARASSARLRGRLGGRCLPASSWVSAAEAVLLGARGCGRAGVARWLL